MEDAADKKSQLVDVAALVDILSSSSSEAPVDALLQPSAQPFLSHITSLPLDQLLAEPDKLQTKSQHLTSNLTSLTHTSYQTFLSLHQNTHSLTDSLSSLKTSLDALLGESLPALEQRVAGWNDRTELLLKNRSKARVVLEQHDKIRDLLEIPLLIDTCVRNGYFSEALSLAAHARALGSNVTTKPMILSSVLDEVHMSMMRMLHSLLATLHEPNRKLPALWKAVNFLRKMDAFGPASPYVSFSSPKTTAHPCNTSEPLYENISTEEQIALSFLVGRSSCLRSILEPREREITRLTSDVELSDKAKEDLARNLKKYIDIWREGVYDIISQYSTIFLERQSSFLPNKTPVNESVSSRRDVSSVVTVIPHLHGLLTTYAARALTDYLLPILETSLPFLLLGHLPSLLTQLTYCSYAFARVGFDFRGILTGKFSRAVASVVSNELRAVEEKWEARLHLAISGTGVDNSTLLGGRTKSFHVKALSVSTSASLPPSSNRQVLHDATQSQISAVASSDGPAHIPPAYLASYPALAEHANGILTVFNGLRLLAPPDLLPEILYKLDNDILVPGGALLREYADGVVGEGEKAVAFAIGEAYFGVFLPFMRRALVEGVYGQKVRGDEWEKGGRLEMEVGKWSQVLGKPHAADTSGDSVMA